MSAQQDRLIRVKEVFNTMIDDCIELVDTLKDDAYDEELDKRFIEKYSGKIDYKEMNNIAGNISAMARAIGYVSLELKNKKVLN